MTAGEMWGTPPAAPSRHPLSKVPEVTAYFWIIKVLTTLMGEATSDYLVHTINPYLAVMIGFTVFVISLILQFAARRYVTWIYWFAVSMVAVFGTMAADVLHVALHVPYVYSTAFFCVVLIVVFVVWYRVERTLSIHSIYTPRREVFYWAAVVTAFALGTASGDMTARVVGLGYLGSGILFTAVIAIPAIAYWWLGLNAIVAFWFAYIVTRPVGASFADYLGFPPSVGGMGIGHGPVALVSALIIAILVGYLAVTGKDVITDARPRREAAPAPSRAAQRDPFRPEARRRSGRHRAAGPARQVRPMAGAEPEPGEPGPGW